MRYLIIPILLFVLNTNIAQTKRMADPWSGRTITTEHTSRTILPLLQQAEQQFRRQDYEEAFFTLENAVAQDPNSSEALLLRARFKMQIGMETEAKEDMQLAMRWNPYVADLYGFNGGAGLIKLMDIKPEAFLTSMSNQEKLSEYFASIDYAWMEQSSTSADLHFVEEIIEQIYAGNYAEALQDITPLIDQFPNSAIVQDAKGLILQRMGNFYAAHDAFKKAIQLDPEFALAWYNLGYTESMMGNFKEAKNFLDKAIELNPDLVKAYFERAKVLKSLGYKEEAIKDYNKIIDQTGENYLKALTNRGLTKKMNGDFGGALADLSAALVQKPDDDEIIINRANLYLLYGFPMKAIEDYTDAIRINNDCAEAYYNRGLSFFIVYDKLSGCADLEKSSDLSYEKAGELLQYFCP